MLLRQLKLAITIGLHWGTKVQGSLQLNEETLRLSIRKGDCGSTCFRLTQYMEDCHFWFVVKETATQPDEEAPILQHYYFPGGNLLLISISEEESDRLECRADQKCPHKLLYKDYIWAIKFAQNVRDEEGNILGVDSVKTLIPSMNRRPPTFRVYPEIIEGPHI